MPTADERWTDDVLTALARDEPFLRQLARHLVRDPGTADDLVQETWLQVFSLRPTIGEGLYGWSATVLRRLAARQRHGELRRAVREAAVARAERLDDPLDAVQRRLDAQAMLVTALRTLPPEQREALVLRYAEERSLGYIAARQGTSVSNVKARLVRARAAMRAKLERTGLGHDTHWTAALAPLLVPLDTEHLVLTAEVAAGAGPPAVAPPLAAFAGPAPVALGLGVSTLASVLIMKKLILAVFVVALGVVGWQSIDPGASLSRSPLAPASASRGEATLVGESSADVLDVASGATREPFQDALLMPVTVPEGPTADRSLAIRGVVVDEFGAPLPDATVTAEHDVWSGAEDWIEEPPSAEAFFTARTGDDGRFELPLPISTLATVRAALAGTVPTVVRGVVPGAELRLVLTRGATLEGDVLDARDRSLVAGALIRVHHGVEQGELTVVHADGVGHFRAEGLTAGTIKVIAAPELHTSSSMRVVQIASGATEHVELLVERGRAVVGTVRDVETGDPIAGARVSAWWFLGKTVATDEQGRFRIDGVALLGGTIVADAPGYGRAEHELNAGKLDDEALELELRLTHAVRLEGRIVDPSGEPIAGAIVAATGRDDPDNADGFDRREWREAVAGDDGRFVIEGARSDITLMLQARAPGFGTRSFHATGADAPRSVELGDLELAPQATLAGRVVDHLGAPMPAAYVGLERKSPTAGFDVARRVGSSDNAGRFYFAGLDACTVIVRVVAPDSRVELREIELREGEHVTEFVVAFPGGEALRGRVSDGSSGAGLAHALVVLSRADGMPRESLRAVCDEAGEFELLAVPAGEWVLRAHPPSFGDRQKPPEFDSLLRFRVVVDGKYLELPLTRLDAELRGQVVNAQGGPEPQRFVARLVDGEFAGESGALTDAEGRFTLRVPSGAKVELAAFMTAAIEASDSLSYLDVRFGRRLLLESGWLARAKAEPGATSVTLRTPGE